MKNQLIGKGRVESLSLNGMSELEIEFDLDGPVGDKHSGLSRVLNGHDGAYLRTSNLVKGDRVFNWRTWTGLSLEEIARIEHTLGVCIPQGCLLENITISGIPDFSSLQPTTRLVFINNGSQRRRPILAVWEENGPCKSVGKRLAERYDKSDLCARFVEAALGNRGVMGFVLSPGFVKVGDLVEVYPPAQ